jgi:microcystin-dependent protein
MLDYVGAAAPSGWLLCDGSQVARADYPELYAKIADTFSVGGESAANFRLPDSRGRTTIGSGSATSGTSSRIIGSTVGVETVTLTEAEMATHDHDMVDPGHSHTFPGNGSDGSGGTFSAATSTGTTAALTAKKTNMSLANTGGGGSHNNMQPSVVLNKIIKV